MSEEKRMEPEFQRPIVMQSLRRSAVRKRIAQYLFDIRPNGSYAADIAFQVHTTPSNVTGAIKGMKSRYRNEESLIGLNLVEQVDVSENMKIYRLTDLGTRIMETMDQR